MLRASVNFGLTTAHLAHASMSKAFCDSSNVMQAPTTPKQLPGVAFALGRRATTYDFYGSCPRVRWRRLPSLLTSSPQKSQKVHNCKTGAKLVQHARCTIHPQSWVLQAESLFGLVHPAPPTTLTSSHFSTKATTSSNKDFVAANCSTEWVSRFTLS